jgi:ubiquinol-cytochrome c reductase cytochrome c subunit
MTAEPAATEIHRPAHFSQPQIAAIVTYVLSFSPRGDPRLPHVSGGDPIRGRTLFAQNCAPCHGAGGSGASIGYATVLQIAEAIRAGPGVMPKFGPDVLSDRDLDDVARYVTVLQRQTGEAQRASTSAGGVPLGFIGPVAEGFVAWTCGLGLLLLFIRSIGTNE